MISNESQSASGPRHPKNLKCPTCNRKHQEKEDVFGNTRTAGDFDVREIFGITATCPICLEECTDVVALPCGHVLCKADYQRMGGFVQCMHSNDKNENNNEDDNHSRVLIHIRNAGKGSVNGTYRQHHHGDQHRYTSMGRYNGEDVEYCIEIRIVDGKKIWYLSCHTGNPSEAPIDFYKAKVNSSCAYPTRLRWEPATLYGIFPSPRSYHSLFH